MLETSDSEINVDRLMHEIREAVARQQPGAQENVSAFAARFPLTGAHAPHALINSSPLTLQPEFHPRPDNQYHVNDLLKYHGKDFVRNAYRAILKREPDAAGFERHLENLASGLFNKIDVLASLRLSAEGERAGVNVEGLKWPVAIRRLGRAPVIGYLVQMLIAMARLPRLLQHQRQSEFHFSAQQQQIVDHDNHIHRQLIEALAQISAQISAQTATSAEKAATQQQAIDLLSQQQQGTAARQIELRADVEANLAATRQQVEQSRAEVQELIQPLLGRQQELTERVDQSRIALTRQLEESAAALIQQAKQSTAALTEQVDKSTITLTHQVEERIQQLLRRQQQIQTELGMQERRLTLLLEKAHDESSVGFAQPLAQQMANEEEHLLDALYASFEDQFRGDREEIKNRMRVYLPILKDAKVSEEVLDIGCGRGEWLELLREEGVRGRGVDHNRVFVEQCRQSGLDVLEDDALRYLRGLPDGSLKVITSFHTVEHLPFEMLIKWLDESVRALKPGGMLILETPDPENFMVGSCNFYTDPTHRNPIPSPTLQFLLESRGLARIKVMKLRPWDAAKIEGDTEIIKRFNEYFYSAPDYGIIGWKV